MPSKSPQQARMMQAVAASPEFAKKVDIPQNVGQEYVAADAAKGSRMKRKMPSFMNDKPAKGKNPFAGKEPVKEEAAERKKFPSKKAYAKAEAKFEGEKYACGGKVKRYADGGEIEEGPNENISDDTRARAMRFARGEMESEAAAPAPRRAAPARAPRPAPKAAPAPAAETPAAPAKPAFSRIPGPAAGSAADKAIKTYEPPSREKQVEALKNTAAKMSMLAGVGAGPSAARGAASAVRSMGKPATEAAAKIGDRVVKTAAERTAPKMNVFGGPRGRSLENPADKVRAASKPAEKAKPVRKRKSDVAEVRGEYLASGGAVRGGGAAKRGVGRGKMC